MNKKVLISVKTTQYSDGDGQPETLELITEGDYIKKGNEYLAIYDETEISGMEGTTTTLRILEDSLNIIRKGTTTSDLLFKKGLNHVSLYATPYGAIEVTIRPRKVMIDVDDNGGNVELEYEMEAPGLDSIKNSLLLNIKEAQ